MEEKPTLDNVQKDTPSTMKYFESMEPGYRGGFLRQREAYKLDMEVVEKLRGYAGEYVIVACFADWCGDSRRAIPVISLLEEEIGIEVRTLGGMKKAPWGSDKQWDVPPSPKEIDIFAVTSSPTIIIFKKSGEEVGRIRTRPKMTKSVEAEILKIIEDNIANSE